MSSADPARNTIFIGCGGALMEMTPAAAQKFVDAVQFAIDCVNKAEAKAGAEHG